MNNDEAGLLLATPPIESTPLSIATRALQQVVAGDALSALDALADFPEAGDLNDSEALLAAGSAWFLLNQPQSAEAYLQAAVACDEGHILAQGRLGACLLAVGKIAEALPHLLAAVQLAPELAGAGLNLARAYYLQEQAEQALTELQRIADCPDLNKASYMALYSEVLIGLQRYQTAEAFLQSVAEQGDLNARLNWVKVLAMQNRHDAALRCVQEGLEQHPDATELLELAAELAQVRGRFGEAAHCLRRALAKHPENAELWARLALWGERALNPREARAAAEQALNLTAAQQGAPRALALAAMADVCADEQCWDDAQAYYQQALAVLPTSPPALNGLGRLWVQLGRVDEAVTLFERLREIAPLQGWSQLIQVRKIPDDPEVLTQLERAAQRHSLEGPVQSSLLFTLAAAYEKQGDYSKAWRFAQQANEAAKQHLPYHPVKHRQRVEREMALFSAEFVASRAGFGDPSQVPVFVLGMPRSGTTLVEQLLGGHSQVFAAGELSQIPQLVQRLTAWQQHLGSGVDYPDCLYDMSLEQSQHFAAKLLTELQAFAPDAVRIIDKLPHNFEHIGLIKLLFPHAKILCLQREPRDVAMSNYFVDYAAKFGGMGFAYDLGWIGEQLVDFQRLMQHWHALFPGQIFIVNYEALVDDVEGWAPRMIDFLGLEWEAQVLDFQSLDRAVKTASVWQVRQPVYNTSKAKWRRYQAYLATLEQALAQVPPLPSVAPVPDIAPGVYGKAMHQLQQGQPAYAEALFRQLLSRQPRHAAAQHFLGAALYQQGKLLEARLAMQHALALHKGHRQWLENLLAVEKALANDNGVRLLENAIARRQGKLPPHAEISRNDPQTLAYQVLL